MPSAFDTLLDELDARSRQREQRRPTPSAQALVHPRRSLGPDPMLQKCLSELEMAARSTGALAKAMEPTPQEKVEDIRQRGRELVARTKQELRDQLETGQISGRDAVRGEQFLNSFCMKLGI